jgi:hypothetical protein
MPDQIEWRVARFGWPTRQRSASWQHAPDVLELISYTLFN